MSMELLPDTIFRLKHIERLSALFVAHWFCVMLLDNVYAVEGREADFLQASNKLSLNLLLLSCYVN